jgi:hypothetical protein
MNDDILKLAAVALISLAVGGAAAVGLVEPAVTGEPPLSDGTDPASGEKQYQAKHVTSTVRYDLTWQTDNPEAIAVEELRGQDFRPRAEQYSAEFAACIAGKNVVPVQGSH